MPLTRSVLTVTPIIVSFLGLATAASAADGAWSTAGSMTVPRIGHGMVLLPNGKVLAAGGVGDRTAELYDPNTHSWTATGAMAVPRFHILLTLLRNGKVLAAGGDPAVASAELYDPATGTWTPTGSMHYGRWGHTATLLPDGKVLYAGGVPSFPPGLAIGVAELYDPVTGAWAVTGTMKQPRYFHTATLLPNGKVLAAGGADDCCDRHYLNTAELYDPATGVWTVTGSMVAAHDGAADALLPNGKVMVLGGYTTAAELYDPATGAWTATGSMSSVRTSMKAVLLPNGKVLVPGGRTVDRVSQASSELYNPVTGTWAATGSMAVARAAPIVLLPSGQALVAGGLTAAGGADSATAEVYGAANLYRGFIPDAMNGELVVYNWATPARIGFVPRNGNLEFAWGTAFSADSSRLFVANGGSGQVSVLDTTTLKYLPSTLNAGGAALYLAAGPTGRFLYVGIGESSSTYALTVIDLTGALPNQTIPLPAQPHRMAVAPDNSHVVVALRAAQAAVVKIGIPHTLRALVPLAGNPNDVVISPDSKRAVLPNAFLTNVNLTTLAKTDWSPPVGCGWTAAFSPAGTRLYLPCTPSGYAVVHGVTGALISRGDLPPALPGVVPNNYFGPRTVSVTPDGRTVWFPGEPYGGTWVLDTATLSLVRGLGGAEHGETKVVFSGPAHEAIDALVGLASSSGAREAAPAACAPGQVYRVTASWKNNSAKAWNDVFAEVLTLTGGNTLIGQTWDLTADGIVNPGETFSGVFRIRLNTCAAFTFQVSLAGRPEAALGTMGLKSIMPKRDVAYSALAGARDEAGTSSWMFDPE